MPALYMKTGLDIVDRPEGWGREQVLKLEAESCVGLALAQSSLDLRAARAVDAMRA